MKAIVLTFAMSLLPFLSHAESFDKLWKKVEAYEEDGLPKSAYNVTQEILKKAQRAGNQGQMLSARLKAASLHQEWAPDSFFTDVAELERVRAAETAPAARAIYASVLAWLYENNKSRSQAYGSELTSDDIHEWTQEQYDSAAVSNWQQSMENIDALAKARSKDWLPFVEQKPQSDYYNHDLLHILWNRYLNQYRNVWGDSRKRMAEMAMKVAQTYSQQGNREAELLVKIDWATLQNDMGRDQAIQLIIEEFGDLQLCAEAYIALTNAYQSKKTTIQLCREAIRRYPNYARTNVLRERLNENLQPSVRWSGENIYYPGSKYDWTIESYNADSLLMETFRMPNDFTASTLRQEPISKAIRWVRQHGTPVESIHHSISRSQDYEKTEDTINWKAYDPGIYVIVLTGITSEGEATERRRSDYSIFRCTRLQTLHNNGLNQHRTIVVDAMSGHPVEGATVEYYYSDKDSEHHTVATVTTDAEGRATINDSDLRDGDKGRRLYTHVSSGDDQWLSDETTYVDPPHSQRDPEAQQRVHLYSDRAIYRPGQTVHVGGIIYNQLHWEAETVEEGTPVRLSLIDTNRKEVANAHVETDAWGKFATSFTLPAKGLPGTYTIRYGNYGHTLDIRVEEYKRPTFEVKMDEAPDLSWPAKYITLTGRAMGYNGVPVRQGRVTGTYRFTYPRWWWWFNPREDSPALDIDTVTTDEAGTFSIQVPLTSLNEETLHKGLRIVLNVDVLNQAGETHSASTSVPLSTCPLRVRLSVPSQQERDRLEPIAIELLSSTEKPTDGTVVWTLRRASDGKRISDDIIRQGKLTSSERHITFPTESLRDLPSGQYELFVEASAGKDSATAKDYFLIFGLQDTRLPKVTSNWLYCPDNTFAPDRPARVQVGTSLNDVAFYYSIVAADSVIEQHLIRLDDELRTLEIPYLDSYGDGATVHTAFVKEGYTYTNSQSLRLQMPENTLRWEWTSFRDRLQPGQRETWTLRITRPDGSPASAQLMATLYDASLDALAPHYWNLYLSRAYNITSLNWSALQFFHNNSSYERLSFPMKQYNAESLAFDVFNEEWFENLAFMHYFNSMRVLEEGAAMPMMMAKRAEPSANMYDSTDAEAAEMEESAVETSAEGESASKSSPAIRTNFNETAAFLPRLTTNARGEVRLTFTLPESLTTWKLLGVAHTQDLMTANIHAEATARKDFMAQLFLPRFLRSGDEATLRATVQNLTERTLNGKATLEVFDPETERTIVSRTANFSVKANGEALLTFPYTPEELPTIVGVRLTAKSGTHTDGEQHLLSILPSKTWVTESVEIHADSIGTFTTDLTSLFNSDSPTATNRQLTVEYTAHPVWYALQALPSLRQPTYDDVLSLTAAITAEGLATHIAATTPRLRTLVEIWRKEQETGGPALDSRLSQNEELKQLILDETPWLREVESEADRKARLIDLFDENLQNEILGTQAQKLRERQGDDGGFAWFPGMSSSELMTQLVAIELTHLRTLTDNFKHLPRNVGNDLNAILGQAVGFIADKTADHVKEMQKEEKKGEEISTASLMYLDYVYITQRSGVSLNRSQKADVRYLLDHLKGSVADMSNNERAKAAIVLKNDGRAKEASQYFASLLEHSTSTAERGTFFDTPSGSFVPTGNKLIVHVAAMEAAREMAPSDDKLRKGLTRWLLLQKRTQMWESCICTSDAIYVLLAGNEAMLQASEPDRLTLNYTDRKVEVTREEADASIAGLGYVKKQFTEKDSPKNITIERHTDYEAWGAVFASYLTPVADVNAANTGLSVRREFSTDTPTVGQRVTIRYVIRADRDYEYVCLSAERPAAAEPASVSSGYEWKNGLGFYRAVRDSRTDFFFDKLPKGTYILEEDAFIDREGAYATGLATLSCLYAPEYTSHTPSMVIAIK